jgi:cyanophycin synthetase
MITPSTIEKIRVGKFSISTSLLIRAALRKGLNCAFLPEKVIKISDQKTSHYFKGTSFPCNNAVAANLSCNKYFLRRLLKEQNLPAPRTLTLRHPTAWQTVLQSSLRFPLVVKPTNASHAEGASMNISTPAELQRAVERAFAHIKKHKKTNRVLVEEYFTGQDLRLLVIGDQVVSVVKREPAYVIGNGNSTIRQLIHAFNHIWRSPIKYDLPLCPIPIDSEVYRCLSKKGLTLNTIPAKNEKIYLRWNANVSTGGRPIEVTNQVHINIKNLAVQVAKISHLEISGVDILCKDISSSDISSRNVSILEINDSPGFDIHHFPAVGTGQDVSSAILDYIFPTLNHASELSTERIEALLTNLQSPYPIAKINNQALVNIPL